MAAQQLACPVSDPLQTLPIRQIAYFVPDIRAAATAHRATFGSGPFLIVDHVATPIVRYRGKPGALDHGSAYGQWGDIMVEFVTQHDDSPSAFHDMYPRGSGRYGMHHVAIWVDDLHTAIERFAALGQECALYAETAAMPYAMVDATATLGHMVELYEPRPVLMDFYRRIRELAGVGGDDWTAVQ